MSDSRPPQEIWLQLNQGEYFDADVTWNKTKVHDNDVEYLRTDIVNDLLSMYKLYKAIVCAVLIGIPLWISIIVVGWYAYVFFTSGGY